MVFSSIQFIFIFLPAVLLLYFLVPGKARNAVLFFASLFFYAWGEPVYVILLLLSAAFNYVMGIDIENRRNQPRLLKRSLVYGIAVNLLLLGFFKYYGFLIGTVNGIFGSSIPYRELALPVGISFFTFRALGYLIDIERGKTEAQRNFLTFALFLCMFPQLTAGPIDRYADLERQLTERSVTRKKFAAGAELFILGLAKKVLLANNAAVLYRAFSEMTVGSISCVMAWLGMLAFTFEIYFDFSGYSDMAIGLAKMFGFEIKKNFDYPYLSRTVTEFWRRWHISLGSWFRDYVYIPLGGNRVSAGRHILNILIVWALTGLWHGAAWTFVFWGIYYGVVLIFEKYVLFRIPVRVPAFLSVLYTMLIVILGWVFFSSPDIGSAFATIGAMFGGGKGGILDADALFYLRSNALLLIVCAVCSSRLPIRIFRKLQTQKPAAAAAAASALMVLSMSFMVYDTYNPFLYFRF
jgi:alginate O-acetyltransferase complex protein AlgI